MYSTHSEGKSVVAERFIRTLKNKFFKQMTVASKNVYFTFLEDIVNKYKNTYHKTNKMKSVDVNLLLILKTMLILMKKILNFKLVIM